MIKNLLTNDFEDDIMSLLMRSMKTSIVYELKPDGESESNSKLLTRYAERITLKLNMLH